MPPTPIPIFYHPLRDDGGKSFIEAEDDDSNDRNDSENDCVPSFNLDNRSAALQFSTSNDVPTRQQRLQNHQENLYEERHSHRTVALILLLICTILVWADQNLMGPNLTAMAHEFGFTDLERDQKLGGDIAVAFFLLGAPASWLMGCLADVTSHRVRLLAGTIVCGEIACVATYGIQTYAQLYTCRALTGLSVGGSLPLMYSLLGDLFQAKDRHTANSYVSMGMGIGISFGQGVAGFLGPTYGWRIPFLIIGCPAVVAAVALALCVTDPERGGMEDSVVQQRQQHERYSNTGRQSSTGRTGSIGRKSPLSGDYTNEDDSKPATLPQAITPNTFSLELSPLNRQSKGNESDEQMDSDQMLLYESDTSHPRQSQLQVQLRVQLQPTDHLTQEWSSWFKQPQLGLEAIWAPCRHLLSTPTVVLALLQGAPGCVPWGIVNTYLTDFLAVDRGLSIEAATGVLLVFGVGNFFGLLVGGHGGTYLYQHISPRAPALLAGGMAMAACLPFWILLNYVRADSPWWMVAAVTLASGLCSGVTGPIIKATLQNVTQPRTRGQAFALFNTFDDFGRGLGPVLCARLIQGLGGRTPAFNVGVLGWLVCGAINLTVWCTVQRDERNMQEQLAARLASTSSPSPILPVRLATRVAPSEKNDIVISPVVNDSDERVSPRAPPPDLWQPTLVI